MSPKDNTYKRQRIVMLGLGLLLVVTTVRTLQIQNGTSRNYTIWINGVVAAVVVLLDMVKGDRIRHAWVLIQFSRVAP